jgi:hypothetical protein
MTMPREPLPLDRLATHVDVDPGGEIVLRGALVSSHDGSTIDAAMTTGPSGDDASGLVDFEAGGFYVTSRNPATHEVHAVATGKDAPACAELGVTAPCLPLRVVEQAHARLLTVNAFASSLKGGVSVEVLAPPLYAPAVEETWLHGTDIAGGVAVAALVFGALAWLRARRRFATSPAGRLRAMAERIEAKLDATDPIVAAPLRPAIASAKLTIQRRRLDPTSVEGQRVVEVLEQAERRLDDARVQLAADKDRAVADAVVAEMSAAVEASNEASVAP